MAFIGGVVLGESPLNSVQMLWVNLIMDTFAALALATEPPSLELLKDRPYPKDDSIVTAVMWRNVIGQSIFQIAILSVFLFLGKPFLPGVMETNALGVEIYDKSLHFTYVFHTFVFMQAFNEINARKLKPNEYNVFADICNNFMFIFIEVLTIIVQVLLVQYGGEYIKVSSLTLSQHVFCILIGMSSLIIGNYSSNCIALLVKFIPVRLFTFKLDERELTEEEAIKSTQSLLRNRSRSLSRNVMRTPSNFKKDA